MKGALIQFEPWVALVAVGAALLVPGGGAWLWRRMASVLDGLARRPARVVVVAALCAAAGSAAVATFVQWPQPRIHDEFSYLLAADTFASGRLANPTHPLWRHFETLQVIHEPSYVSKYPPGPGLFLALGQVLGDPLVGVWLAAALMAGALAWMARGWLPPRWAVLVAVLGVVRLGVATYFSQSYWGGALPVAGGALLFGALPRLRREPRVREALVAGAGLMLLALCRPWEGLVASLPSAVVVGAWWLGGLRQRGGLPRGLVTRRLALPLLGMLALTAGALAVSNEAVTGDPLRMPYMVYEDDYVVAPPFLWMSPRPVPEYRHQAIEDFWTGFYLDEYRDKRSWSGFSEALRRRGSNLWSFYLGVFLTLPLLWLPGVLRDRWMRFALLTVGVLALALAGSTYYGRHYAAPVAGPLLLLVVASMRRMAAWRGRRGGRRRWGQALLAGLLVASLLRLGAQVWVHGEPDDRWYFERARMEQRLRADGGRHLIVVGYEPGHNTAREWVYNRADIDAAAVVWAREMSPAENAELLAYFADRTVWRLQGDAPQPRLQPWDG